MRKQKWEIGCERGDQLTYLPLLLTERFLMFFILIFFGVILSPPVIGLLLGALMPFAIASFTLNAVGRAANKMVMEIRRQFKEIAGLMDGKAKPDSDRCIDIVTRGALIEMILPGLAAVIMPLFVGFVLGKEALGGFLAGATATGVLLAIFMANAGAAWDNAKKWIEEGNLGGKGTETHAALLEGAGGAPNKTKKPHDPPWGTSSAPGFPL